MGILRPRGLFEYVEILWRKKLLIFLVAASVSIATLLIISRIPNIYESHASIVISNQGNSNDDRLLSSPSLTALTQRMTSDGNLTAIIRRYDLYHQTPGRIQDPNVAVERLRRSVKIDIKMRNYYPEAPESLTISYRYTDPAIAQRVVADLVSIFEQTNVTMRRQAATELERFRAKIAEVETQLQSLAPQRDLAFLRNETARRLDNDSSTVRTQRSPPPPRLIRSATRSSCSNGRRTSRSGRSLNRRSWSVPPRPPVEWWRTALTAFYWRAGPRLKGRPKISPHSRLKRIPR